MKTRRTARIHAVKLACVVLSLTLLPACPVQPQPVDLEAAYQAAIEDAKTVSADEISKDLWAIVPSDERLIWEGEPGKSRVLVVTWTSYTGYNDKVGQDIEATREIWVSPSPEVKDWVRQHLIPSWDLTLRLEELLGVPPNGGKTTFVEFWVQPTDLFRPSPDPETTDEEAELDFPQPASYVTINPDYIQWFTDLMAVSYLPNGYPWTRLGYTYDWGNSANHVGVSEFVIPQGVTIGVFSSSSTEDYCRWW